MLTDRLVDHHTSSSSSITPFHPSHNHTTTHSRMPNQHTKKRKLAAAANADSDAESSTAGGNDNDIGLGSGKGDVNEPGISLYVQIVCPYRTRLAKPRESHDVG